MKKIATPIPFATACFLLLLWLSAAIPVLAQTTKPISQSECGVIELNPQQRQALEAEAAFALKTKRATQGKALVITYVPIRPHILRRTNGTGGFTVSQLNQVMALTNRRFLQNGLGIQFYLAGTTPDYVDNDTWFANFDGQSTTENAIANPRDVGNAMNAYFCQGMPYNGYAYFPDNALYSTRMFLNGTLNTYYLGSGTMPHELGHNFNLIHTFGESSATAELVTRGGGANCTTAGDLICDTPADPGRSYPGFAVANQNGCDAYTGNCQDANGASFSPDITNLMSYYNSTACRDHFTPGQYDRIDGGLALRQSHTAYSLDYPSTNASAPTDVVATRTGNTMVITWQDEATNEMGYFIERSTTSPVEGFVPVGGVAPNVMTFTDNEAPANGAVYYRVRPSNSTGNISAVVCRPVFVYGCTRAVGFDGFTVNNVVLSQNTGCASGTVGYSQYYGATWPTVLPGETYSFSGTLLGNQVGITIWADLNRNGSFGDAGEKLFQTPAATLTTAFSGSLTIPVGTTPGGVFLRIVSSYLNVPGGPCNNYDDGETEDYVLNVGIRRYVSRTGTNTDPYTAISWATATTDLQGAINASAPGQTIFVKAGFYTPTTGTDRSISFSMKDGVQIYGGFAGTEITLANRLLTFPLNTILSGDIGTLNDNVDNSHHVINNPAGLTSTAILDGFVITGGNADGNSNGYGAGMLNTGGAGCSPTLRNCLFQRNSASLSGGAICNSGTNGISSPTLINCAFQNNSATYGGAILNDGNSGKSNPDLANCSFQGNTANFGGAIFTTANGGVSRTTLLNCVLFGNGGANTFAGTPGISARYSLFDASVTSYTSGPGNLTTTTSPFASTASTQLYAYSPAMDMGDPATTTATVGATDLAGNVRVFGSRIDMGAYEFNGPFPAKLYVRAGATGANTGLNWTDAFTDLQSALTTTTVGNSLTAIWVAAGLYKPTSTTARNISFAMKNGVTILGGFAGTGGSPDVRTPLSSTLSGDIGSTGTTDNSYHVIRNPSGLTGTAILDGFVITGGNTNGAASGDNSGGGMCNRGINGQECSPTIRNCLFQNNSTDGYGGAIANVGSTSGSSSPTLINCAFQNNISYLLGGAVSNNQFSGGSSRPSFINCSFQFNYSGSAGGAIANEGSSGFTGTTLTNCVFYDNDGSDAFYSSQANSLSASYCLFDASVTGYTSGPGNLTVASFNASPFASSGTMQLAACSPAINAGLNSAIIATNLTTDIAGNPRLYGGTVDMGAYEVNSPLPVLTNLSVGTPTATSVVVTWTMTPATAPTEIRWRAVGTTAWSSATVVTGISSYSITGLTVETTYEWQVRPNCPATSNYVSGSNFSTSPYCRPTYSFGCNSGSGDALTSFSLDNVALSQNTGCSAGSFTYITTNRQVVSGQPVTVSGTFSFTYSEGVAIWGDLNRNNVFESNEILYQRAATPGPFSGMLTIPSGTATGALRIRVLVAFNTTPANPCGSYGYGETEDYQITVTPGTTCPAMTTTKAGAWNDPTVWSCNRVPTATDAVTIGHTVTVPGGVTSNALKISYGAGGKLSFDAGSKIRLGL